MKKKLALFLGLLFFIVAALTVKDYGINWDTINHLPRGQAYLHLFLTGQRTYPDSPKFKYYWQDPNSLAFKPDIPKSEVPRVSLYQAAGVDANYFLRKDGGHPPLSDILSSAFNYVLFQKLGLINDIDSYRLYGIVLAAGLVSLVCYWTSKVHGTLAGVFAAFALATYPLFWSETHFNTEKDIPETVYWSLLLYSLWKGVNTKSWKWLLLSGMLFGLAIGTKFNVLFVVFVVLPWLLLVKPKILFDKWFLLTSFVAAIIALIIFVGSWPYLWADPVVRIGQVVDFYKTIGITETPSTQLVGPFGTNLYPLHWVLYATPLVTLVLAVVGLASIAFKKHSDKSGFNLLVVFWLAIPLVRVVWPGATVYGGARQFMEYIPALAICAGIAVDYLYKMLPWGKLKLGLVTILGISYLLVVSTLVRIHPNENLFFNSLVGGLSGAKQRDFPFWGNSFGAAYRQGAQWLNLHAEKGAHLTYAYELIPNIPRIFLRTDFELNNRFRSGYLRKGEYAITLPFQGTENRSYFDMYLRKFLVPVYEDKVDGVPVVTVWKNSDEYLKAPWNEVEVEGVTYETTKEGVVFDLHSPVALSRLELTYDQTSCELMTNGYIKISVDGSNWQSLPGSLPRDWLIPVLGQQPTDGGFIYPFTGQITRYITLVSTPADSCVTQIDSVSAFELL